MIKVLGIIIIFAFIAGLVFKDSLGQGILPVVESSQSETQASKSRSRSHSSNSLDPLTLRDVSSRSVLLKSLQEQLLLGDENFTRALTEMLRKDEDLVFQALADSTWFEENDVDVEMVGKVILKYYENDIFKGLENFSFLKQNQEFCALNLHSLVEVAWQDNPEQTKDWLLKNYDFEEIDISFERIGELSIKASFTPNEIDESIQQVLASDASLEAKSSYLGGLYANWIKSDFDGALEHLLTQEKSLYIDHAISRVLLDIAKVDLEGAQKWAEHISDEVAAKIALEDINEMRSL